MITLCQLLNQIKILVPITDLDDNHVPTTESDYDLIPITDIDDNPVPTTESDYDPVPITELDDNPVPTTEIRLRPSYQSLT